MNTEKLIELVREHKILYDLSDPYYVNSKKKNLIWYTIGRELNTDPSACKSRWNNIRDQYRKSLKRIAIKNDKKSKKHYRYHEKMEFLRPHFNERENTFNDRQGDTADTVDSNSQNSEQSLMSLLEIRPNIEQASNSVHLPEEQDPNVIYNASAVITPRLSTERASEFRSTPSPGSFHSPLENIQLTNTTAVNLIEYLLKKKQEDIMPHITEEHPMDKFMQCIAPTLKSLTPYYQNLAKTEIFNFVQKYEMTMFTQNKEQLQMDVEKNIHDSCVTNTSSVIKKEK
ncbi:uncharacterized protein LOC131852075 [Achroia grisella]|uniref:uncharacterized protein LOC131852075 n=1 Tax=Achroia grisella TaxID=688607 RepID=UPI0027D31272|nr:uncharacterized protein LOC131852075 [Achroia grisella]